MRERIERIHETSMAILEKVGIKLHHAGICSVLKEKGIKVNKTLERILSSYEQPILEPELRSDLEKYLTEIGVDAGLFSMLLQTAGR